MAPHVKKLVVYYAWWRPRARAKKVKVMASTDSGFLLSMAEQKFDQLLRESGLRLTFCKGAVLTIEGPGGRLLKRVSWSPAKE